MTIDGERWKQDLDDLKQRIGLIEIRHTEREEDIIRRAVRESQKSMLANLGVDIDNPESVDAFRKNIQFNQGVRKNLLNALGAFVFAICGAMGVGVWNLISAGFGKGG
jgi:hypothetical protein